MTTFLTEADISRIRAALVAMFEGDDTISPLGVRDQNLVASARSRPATSFGEVEKYPSVAEKAAALLHALIANHPFWNGNKRTAFLAMIVFVELNGWTFDDAVTDDAIVDVVVSVAAHRFPSADRGHDADAVVAALAVCIEANIVPSRTFVAREMNDVIGAALQRFAQVLRGLADA
jgi:death-on-curing family protein